MALNDGVSKLWIVRADRGLYVDGFKDEIEAIGALVRQFLSQNYLEAEESKSKIMAEVGLSLKHLDPNPRSCNRHGDCDVADAEAKAHASHASHESHCHDDCCEDCFGQ